MADDGEEGEVQLADGEEGEGKRKKPLVLILVLVALVVLVGGGVAGYFLLKPGDDEGAGEEPAEVAEVAPAVLEKVPLDSFVINLNEAGSNRYLKADIVLEMRGTACKDAIAGKKEALRDSIILLLRSKRLEDIRQVDGVLALKREISARVDHEQSECTTSNVFFTDLVIQ